MKNVRCQVNFSRAHRWYDPLDSHVKFFEEATVEECIANPIEHPKTSTDAEFIMLAGISGISQFAKTHWAEKHMADNPTKNYALVGLNTVFDQLEATHSSMPRNPFGRWNGFYSQATHIFHQLVEIAGKHPRNIILDVGDVDEIRSQRTDPFKAFGTRRILEWPKLPESDALPTLFGATAAMRPRTVVW